MFAAFIHRIEFLPNFLEEVLPLFHVEVPYSMQQRPVRDHHVWLELGNGETSGAIKKAVRSSGQSAVGFTRVLTGKLRPSVAFRAPREKARSLKACHVLTG